ncbi:Spectrin Beta Chain, Non-Erythrocytic 5 [Manis pentadactyla]|nr:Spectrin Beta Chain, Non-Erythrocytic 5 [Manis pentadactyla]
MPSDMPSKTFRHPCDLRGVAAPRGKLKGRRRTLPGDTTPSIKSSWSLKPSMESGPEFSKTWTLNRVIAFRHIKSQIIPTIR